MSPVLVQYILRHVYTLAIVFDNLPALNAVNLLPLLAGIPAVLSLLLYLVVYIRQSQAKPAKDASIKADAAPSPIETNVSLPPIQPDSALSSAGSARLRTLSGMIDNAKKELASYSPSSLPWAESQQYLGDLYIETGTLITDNACAFLQEAIHVYEAALTVYTPESAPREWAGLHYKLAQCYYQCNQLDAQLSLEPALQHIQLALSLYTMQTTPQEWARAEMLCGTLYQHRSDGEQRQNLDAALACYLAALGVYSVTTHPREWASAMYAQGYIYSKLMGPERHIYLETAVACYKAALEVYNKQGRAALLDNAQTLHQLGRAYTDLSSMELDNASRYLQTAITSYQTVLPIYDREHYPLQRAAVLNDLGRTYLNNPLGDRTTMLKKAIECHVEALQLYTPETSPDEWAWTHCYLGDAYKGYSRATADQAHEHYQLSLSMPEAKAPVLYARNRLKELDQPST